ncbi:MAG: polyprenyl synthetase family protein [Firmicutes bacterium]|nr:polyprenyl synthetase family protein [Bacillota bacterium]
MEFQNACKEKQILINETLTHLMAKRSDCPSSIVKAMEYSLLAVGKRLRPILLLSANELVAENSDACLNMACAIEMIHAYSLIHDDLPAMDDDDYRRGIPSNHKVFGEALAILAGDGLLNLAYEVMLEKCPNDPKRQFGYIKAMSVIASAAGISGMVGGQVVDMESENSDVQDDTLSYIHKHKTEALITAALHAGVLVHTTDIKVIEPVISYGKAIGMAFQITDDILDVTGDMSHLGKSTGSDAKKGKLTFPSRFGLDASRKMAEQYIDQAIASIDSFHNKGAFLKQLAISILVRDN